MRYFIISLLLLAAVKAESPAFAAPEKRLVLAGAGSGVGAMRRMAEGFQKRHPGIAIDLLPDIGSTGAIRAVAAGKVDIALSSRSLTPEERGMGMIQQPYGRTPIVFAVQASNPTDGVTSTEIEDIYSGKRQIWPDGRRVRPILRPRHDSFSLFLEGISPRFKAAHEMAQKIPGVSVAMTDQEAVELIEKTPGSFGTSTASLMAVERRRIKALAVDGALPLLRNIADGTELSAGKYPYVMTMALVYRADANSRALTDFVRFVFSKEGEKFLSESDHIVLPQTTGR